MKNYYLIFLVLISVVGCVSDKINNSQQITADLLSGGIGEAMMTTVAGLIVGIFAYIGYNLLSSMINKVVYKMEATSVEFLDILHEPA